MLRSAKEMEGYAVGATDGDIGHVKDFYFDDKAWVIRYLVVETGGWLSSRKVLVSPIAIGTPDWQQRHLPASISQEQIRKSPDIDTDQPVSRQHEIRVSGYYDYLPYWGGAGLWGGGMYPGFDAAGPCGTRQFPGGGAFQPGAARKFAPRIGAAPARRPARRPRTFAVATPSGAITFTPATATSVISRTCWSTRRPGAVRYLVIDTSNWWLGHQVLIAPPWIEAVNWADESVSVSMTRQAIKDAPVYDPEASIDRQAEEQLYQHYGHVGYWSGYPISEDSLPAAATGQGSGSADKVGLPPSQMPRSSLGSK